MKKYLVKVKAVFAGATTQGSASLNVTADSFEVTPTGGVVFYARGGSKMGQLKSPIFYHADVRSVGEVKEA